MKTLITAAVLAFGFTAGAMAADSSCTDQAAEKKLSGAAKTSFIKKCEKDAGGNACNKAADDKKLAGAARNSFVKKCNADAAASAPKKG